jgi:asparagine synthase (glutamine-hydrolysing)
MSGIFGAVDAHHNSESQQLSQRMATAMCHRDWYQVDEYFDEKHNLAVGRIGIGTFNREAQPVFDESHNIFLVMAGEVYEREKFTRSDAELSDEEYLLEWYNREGAAFISNIEGMFVAAIVDLNINKLMIFTDRFGQYPLFFSTRAGRLIFAPEMKGILCDEYFPKNIDYTALAQYVRFQQVLGVRTFFEDIQVLPPASVLTFDIASSSFSIIQYWSFNDIQFNPQISIEEAIEESARLMVRSIKKRTKGDFQPGVYLSGGLDSRTILGLIDQRPVATVTYGRPDCRDVIYAKRLADKAGSQHHWIDFPNGDWVADHFDFHLDLTEGYHSWIHSHGISTLPVAREVMDVNLTGLGGGTVMGKHFIEPRLTNAVDNLALTSHFFYKYNQKYTWPSISEGEEHLLYPEPLKSKIQGLAYESFCKELEPYLDYRRDVKTAYFHFRNHEWRFIANFVTFTRSHVEVRIPYYDYELFDFMHSLPVEYRENQRMFRPVMQKLLPELTTIPYDYDEFLPTTNGFVRNSHSAMVKIKRRFNRHIWNIFPEYHTLYADYETYLRTDLKDWAENILFDKRTAAREIFNPTYLHTLMNRHHSGLEDNTIGKIAPLITYEMMLRRYYD